MLGLVSIIELNRTGRPCRAAVSTVVMEWSFIIGMLDQREPAASVDAASVGAASVDAASAVCDLSFHV